MKLIIDRNYPLDIVTIYGLVGNGVNESIIGFDGKNLINTQLEQFVPIKTDVQPLLILPRQVYNDVLKGFAEEANKMNINTEAESTLRGKLEATERHLSDMKLAFETLLKTIK